MTTITSIKNDIIDGRFTEDELFSLNKLVVAEIKEARNRASRRAIQQLQPGNLAKVTGRLRGDAYYGEVGVVTKVNRTRVQMRFEGNPRLVNIPANVLEPVDE